LFVRGNETISYFYDAVGNRLSKTDQSGTSTSTFDENDRILRSGSTNYAYDDNGNTLSTDEDGFIIEYFYNQENQLIQANTTNGVAEYEYDSDGIRVSNTLNGEITHYLVDKNRRFAQVLEESNDGGLINVSYVHGDDLISQNRESSLSIYHYNGHGSTTALTNHLEEQTDQYIYDAFGELLAQTGDTVNDYLYTGEQYDPNLGFYYLRARYYNNSIGRFHSMDTWLGRSSDPVTLHKYLYAYANPVMFVDPSGNMSLQEQTTVQRTTLEWAKMAQSTGTQFIKQFFFGGGSQNPVGLIGRFIVDEAKDVIVEMVMNELTSGLSATVFGTKAHSQFEKKIKALNRRLKSQKFFKDIRIEAEFFVNKDGDMVSRRAKGSVGIDVMVFWRGKRVLAFDLKTGRGMGKKRKKDMLERLGVDIVEIFVKRK